jgi:hypothetical protein
MDCGMDSNYIKIKNMKNLIKIWRWFLSFFRSKKQVSEVRPIIEAKTKVIEPIRKRHIPVHNNRKRTRGRVIQEVRMDGGIRFIYH